MQRSGQSDAGNQVFYFYCQKQIKNAFTVRDATYLHECIIVALELETLTVHAFPCKDYQVVIDVLQASQDRYAFGLEHLKVAFK